MTKPLKLCQLDVRSERVIAEGDGDGWLVMWPDGTVQRFEGKPDVLRAIRRRVGGADVLLTTVEWRR